VSHFIASPGNTFSIEPPIRRLGVDKDMLIPINDRDEKKARTLLSRPNLDMPQHWRKELMRILHTRRKAEIEILSPLSSRHFPGSHNELGRTRDPDNVQGDIACTPAMSPLLRYLVTKISSSVTLYKR